MGVRWTSRPSRWTARRATSTASPPQEGAHPCHKLARCERLGHVVVRAGVQCADLVVLVVDRRQDDERDRAPLPQLPAQIHAVGVRQRELDDRSSQRAERRNVEGLVGRCRNRDPEAGVTQHPAERAHRAPVVVTDEDGLHQRRARRRR
jgi:hypothetical protein